MSVGRLRNDEIARRAAELNKIRELFGEDAKVAMHEYLSIFDDRFYLWLAGLFDPATGAFYYSNSGRDTDGYLPDIESTTRGWGWVSSSGMMERYDGDLKAALPESIVSRVLTWITDLQSSEDGYFYHPSPQ